MNSDEEEYGLGLGKKNAENNNELFSPPDE